MVIQARSSQDASSPELVSKVTKNTKELPAGTRWHGESTQADSNNLEHLIASQVLTQPKDNIIIEGNSTGHIRTSITKILLLTIRGNKNRRRSAQQLIETRKIQVTKFTLLNLFINI